MMTNPPRRGADVRVPVLVVRKSMSQPNPLP